MSSVDEQVLRRSKKSSDDKLNEFKEAQASQGNEEVENGEDLGSEEKAGVLKSVKKKAKEAKEKAKGIKEKVGAGIKKIKMILAGLLRKAWINLLPSWGLTIIWINIHAFLAKVFGHKIFCKLGEEWALRAKVLADKPGKSGEKFVKKVSKGLALPERMLWGCCNLVFLLLIISFLVQLMLMLEILTNPIGFLIENIGELFGYVWKWITGTNSGSVVEFSDID